MSELMLFAFFVCAILIMLLTVAGIGPGVLVVIIAFLVLAAVGHAGWIQGSVRLARPNRWRSIGLLYSWLALLFWTTCSIRLEV